ncbi:Uncharacterised protein [Vibrio cholerae]|nr:Uncharacterised protein [Vibrio cholerae]CSB16126.1 Uncharacterised protein [Vibrio cholerae]CSC93090.1 Uncharacterised protein [Vibrio cholerae]CSD25254.1 Uncharacterised protein [Vibrio cholerae]CSD61458.1 Uncharacterised protein [Vibrio cholerae]
MRKHDALLQRFQILRGNFGVGEQTKTSIDAVHGTSFADHLFDDLGAFGNRRNRFWIEG